MTRPALSVVICTRNPHPGRLARTLDGLRRQTLPPGEWELVLVDNGSDRPLPDTHDLSWHPAARVVRENTPGLTPARVRGVRESAADSITFVDDDNVLGPDYLAAAVRRLAAHPDVGTAGGVIRPEYETRPPAWFTCESLLALRDLGDQVMISPPGPLTANPVFTPFGAGMVARRAAIDGWLAGPKLLSGRVGSSLSSCEDTDMVLDSLKAGWKTAYFPELRLTHLIPASRLDPGYLERLSYASAKSYAQTLSLHGIGPRSPIPRWTLPLRKVRAYLRLRPWRGPAARLAWRSACGHFDGLADPLPPDAFLGAAHAG